jgi:hypothetical protein
MNHGNFETYWFATGTPTFLIKLMEEQRIDILELGKREVAFSESGSPRHHDFYAQN